MTKVTPKELTDEQWREFYSRCYDVLVQEGGASADERDKEMFVNTWMEEEFEHYEYRFCGEFGFGGKFWRANRKVYVNYYFEHRAPRLDKIEESINNKLLKLQAEFLGEDVAIFGPPKKHADAVRWRLERSV